MLPVVAGMKSMRYITFSLIKDPAHRLGVLRDDRLMDLRILVGNRWEREFPKTLLELIASGPESCNRLATRVEYDQTLRRHANSSNNFS